MLANTPYPWLFDLSEERAREIDLYVAGRGEDVEGAGGLETSKTLVPYTNYIVRDERVDEGDVLVLYGRMPLFPDTRSGPATMPTGQIRYWSLTTYNTGDLYGAGEATASVMDDELVYDAECRYVLVLSRPQDRPANATAANGVTWMPWRGRDPAEPVHGATCPSRTLRTRPRTGPSSTRRTSGSCRRPRPARWALITTRTLSGSTHTRARWASTSPS